MNSRPHIRVLGGGRGCLGMFLFSVLASVILSVVLNVAIRLL